MPPRKKGGRKHGNPKKGRGKPKGLGDFDIGQMKIENEDVSGKIQRAIIGDISLERTIERASTLSFNVLDPEREILQADLLRNGSELTFDDMLFTQVQLSKSGNQLSVTYEDAAVRDLRKAKGQRNFTKGKISRRDAAKELVSEVGWLKFKGEQDIEILDTIHVSKKQSYWEALTQMAEDRQWRLFVNEGTVWFGSDQWLGSQKAGVDIIEEADASIQSIDFELDSGKKAETATINCFARRWYSHPGEPVYISDLGPAMEGMWLCHTFSRSLSSQLTTITLGRKVKDKPEPKPGQNCKGSQESLGATGPVQKGANYGGRMTASFAGREGVAQIAAQAEAMGYRIGGLEGWRGTGQISSGHVTNSNHYNGTAMDIFYDGDSGTGETNKLTALANYFKQNVIKLNELFYPFNDPSGAPGSHRWHVHVSINSGGGLSASPGQKVGNEVVEADCTTSEPGKAGKGSVEGKISGGSVEAKIRSKFGKYATTALCIARAESGLRNVYNGSCCYGVFQIHASAHNLPAQRLLTDVDYNINQAYRISGGGRNWSAWTTHGGCGV